MITYEQAYKLACHGMLIEQLQDKLFKEKSLKDHVIKFLIELNERSEHVLFKEGYRFYVVGNLPILGKNINNAIANYKNRLKNIIENPVGC